MDRNEPGTQEAVMSTPQLPDDFDWKAFTPDDSPLTPMDVMADARHQQLSTPDLVRGDPAYDFTSPIYDFSDGTEVATGDEFNLVTAAREKPVALIFGSYT
jgi:hypothetical protein